MEKQTKPNFVRLKRFAEAMTHGSFDGDSNNKQLALLGDAVIDLVVCEHILENFPQLSVGAITEQRATVVNCSSLAQKARALNLSKHLLLGEQLKNDEKTEHMLAEALEALAGAVFVEHGYERAKQFIAQHIIPKTIATDTWNPKGRLQEVTQNQGLGIPTYTTKETHIPGEVVFEATIFLGGSEVGQGKGASKKEAEEIAAKNALLSLKGCLS